MLPEITVIIPYYNESESIEMTLELIASQTLKPVIAILVNSSSTDNCSQIIDEWISQYQGPIKFLNIFKSSNTPSSSKNIGIKISTTPWVAFMDCGLVFQKEWLELQWKYLTEHTDCNWVSGVCYFKGVGVIDQCAVAHTYGYERKRPTMPTSLIKKELFNRFGLFLENRRAGYDAAWPLLLSRNGIKRGINFDVIIKYERVNFGSTFAGIFRKSFDYNLPTVNMPYYYVPYYYLALFFLLIFAALLSPLWGLTFFLLIFLIRSFVLPAVKSQNFYLLKKGVNYWMIMPLVALAIDSGRMLGILRGTWKYHLSHIFE